VGQRARASDLSQSGAPRERDLRLLRAYCVELGGDVPAARKLYSSIAADSASEPPGSEAALRLREWVRLESSGVTRVQLKDRVFEERKKSPHDPTGVHPLRRADPSDPKIVAEAEIEASVLVGFEIESDGTVVDPLVLESTPPFGFDGAAIEAVRTWTYERSHAKQAIRDVVVPVTASDWGLPKRPDQQEAASGDRRSLPAASDTSGARPCSC
jgi:TonB family protein